MKIALPTKWKKFVTSYGKNRAYWYAPKGLAVTPEAIKNRLQVLKQFEHGKPWRDVQSEYIAALRDAKISDAEEEWENGGWMRRSGKPTTSISTITSLKDCPRRCGGFLFPVRDSSQALA